jgi:hypothetical protein
VVEGEDSRILECETISMNMINQYTFILGTLRTKLSREKVLVLDYVAPTYYFSNVNAWGVFF